ncbi:MMPL family transporter [Microbacterium sp. KSW2-21]|uniref:MMPL family transporter n=1 Tax=Microbacterium algihabitans TaxID=3075992 RepID=A0ABU3RZX7_9MICO|nr:MMPL family transporter [Microbacterium sp. KSW2-21]MDU0328438.1 MMPL family transporter [Microbacterium sp. KSW2-21]
MSTFLARLGRYSARHRLVVIGAWLVVFAGLITTLIIGTNIGGVKAAETSVPNSAASQALERMDQEFPSASEASAATLQLVFQPGGGSVTDPAVSAQIAAVLADASALPGVASVTDPFDPARPSVSGDSSLAVATLSYDDLSKAEQEADYAAALELRADAPADLGVELGGNLVPIGAPAPGIGEGVGVIIAFLVLILTFGSLLAAGVNLLIAVFGVGVGIVGVLAYGSLFPLGENAIILAPMLGLAVGIDYTLFILSRFRIEVRSGKSIEVAVARATGTAGTAVVFAGLTVIVALVALLVANLSFVTEMGIAAAVAVLVAVLVSLTLLPALLKTLGLRALSKEQRAEVLAGHYAVEGGTQKRGIMRGWSSFVVNRPIISALAGIIVLVIVALPMFSMKTAFNIPGGADPESTERTAYNLIVDEFGGIQGPLIVLAEGADVASHTDSIQARIAQLEGVAQVAPAEISADGTMARLVVIPEGSPIDQETKDIVHTLREDADALPGVHLDVTGETAIGIDQDAALMSALVKYIIVIVAISLVLLIVMFRSLLIPLIATLGYLLSVGASFGASTAVFQWGWLDAVIAAPQGDPMLSLLPLLLVGVLFGLAMDYQVFLVSRIKEMHDKGISPKEAIREGFARSGPVLVAAAAIMTVVFGGFATGEFAIGASIAFGLMVGVMADAFIVRLVLMPALLSLLGKSAWWMPKWLDRIVPKVNTEGHALDDRPHAVTQERVLENA